MTRHALVLVGLCAALFVAASTARAATTYYVATIGNDNNPGTSNLPFLTIQHAANAAGPGDRVVVRAGTYAGAKFSISGTAVAPITFTADPGVVVASAPPQNSNGDNLWIRDASFITIAGFEVRTAPRAGIAVQAEPDAESHGVVLRSNYCHDNTRWGIFTAYAEGILIELNECSFSGIEHGIYVSNSSDNPIVRRNRVHHNHASGIQLNADPALDGDGIFSNALVVDNIVWENGTGGGAAINLASVINSRIANNVLYDNHSTGIAGWDDGFSEDFAFGTHDNTIVYNTIVQASDGRNVTSFSRGSYGNTVKDNILIHTGTRGSIEVDASSETGLQSDYNVIVDKFAVDDVFITASQWRARQHDAHSIVSTAAANFVDLANHNYHLKTGAPALNVGVSIAGTADDRDGKHRPQGGGYDMGAYEFRGADTTGVFLASASAWFLKNANASGSADLTFVFGGSPSTFVPLVGDWNGDGLDTPGLYDPATGVFFLRNTAGPGPADLAFSFGAGNAGYVPVVGDWNGDSLDTIGIYQPATGAFFLRNSNSSGAANLVFTFGPAGLGWSPLAGDWDGDGTDTVGAYSPTGSFFLKNTNGVGSADLTFSYGPANATPIVGDWNADGLDSIGVVTSSSAWFLRNSSSPGAADVVFSYGPAGAIPTDGDWNAQ